MILTLKRRTRVISGSPLTFLISICYIQISFSTSWSEQICKDLIGCLIQISVGIGKSASVPSEVSTVSDIVTTGFMIVIFAGSRIPRHISFCQFDRLASVSSAWCRCSGNLYAGIRCTVEDHNTLIGTLSENDPSMSAVVSDISRIKLPVWACQLRLGNNGTHSLPEYKDPRFPETSVYIGPPDLLCMIWYTDHPTKPEQSRPFCSVASLRSI